MTFPSNRFTWFEYATADRAKAQGFYGELFNWQTRSIPTGATTYDLITSGDQSIGSWLPAPAAAHWNAYILVEDVKATVAKVRAAGGTVTQDVTPRGTVGHYALVADPQGAAFALWQPTTVEANTDFKGVPGMPCWAELFTSHSAAAVNFYEAIGDFLDEPMPMGGPGSPTYHVLASGGAQRAGLMDAPMPGIAPHWKPFIQVANADEAAAKAKRLGATIVLAPHDVPHVGRSGMFVDPLGASVGILQPVVRPS